MTAKLTFPSILLAASICTLLFLSTSIGQGSAQEIEKLGVPIITNVTVNVTEGPPLQPPPPLLYHRCNIFRVSENKAEFFACCRNYPTGTWFCPLVGPPPPGHICASVDPPDCCCANVPPIPTTTTTTTTEKVIPAFVDENKTDEEKDEDENEQDDDIDIQALEGCKIIEGKLECPPSA